MGLPAILLGLKTSRRRLGRTGACPKTTPAPKVLLGALWGTPVEMLLTSAFRFVAYAVYSRILLVAAAKRTGIWYIWTPSLLAF
jgi:hypothetical protein